MNQQIPSPSPVNLSERVYRHLLVLYPSRFRAEYGREMTLVFRSQCRHLVQRHGEVALAQLWFSTLGDLISTALAERMKEGFSMSKALWVQLSGIMAVVGGLLGLYLALLGTSTNGYGNYGWNSGLTPVVILLLAMGFSGWFVAYHEQMDTRGRIGFAIGLVGLLSMAAGYLVEALWFFIFAGPMILLPIGAILLGISAARKVSLPAWWRLFPYVLTAIALLGFGIEMWEGITGNSVPDHGLQTVQFLLSVLWLGLGAGLWAIAKRPFSQSGAM